MKRIAANKEGRPVIGLALGSGSARGWAHFGVIAELKEMGIEPDLIAGCSIGSLVGGAWAANYLDEFQKWVLALTQWDVIKLLDIRLSGGGMIGGERLMDFFSSHLGQYHIETLEKPFAAVSTDLETGREVWLQEGALLDAIRASIAMPVLFTPVLRNGRWLSDGGLVNPVPISLAKALGADIVISVNLNGDLLKEPPTPSAKPPVLSSRLGDMNLSEQLARALKKTAGNLLTRFGEEETDAPDMFDVLLGSINIMQDRITRSRMAGDPPDVNISPRLSHIRSMEFHRADECIAEGRAAVRRNKDALQMALG